MDPHLVTALAIAYGLMTLATTFAHLDGFAWYEWVSSFILGLIWPLVIAVASMRILRAADERATAELVLFRR